MLEESLRSARVLPVITADNVENTVRLCQALQAGGMNSFEVTMRTDAALDAIRELKLQFPGLCVAAGTVTNAAELDAALQAGADFLVSPGLTPGLLAAARSAGASLLPGVATASEVMLGMEQGLRLFKLFPAAAVGGIGLLKSLGGPFPQLQFCPTGGLTPQNFRDYLALPNVLCCGGSWMVSAELVDAGRWEEIEQLAREAVAPA